MTDDGARKRILARRAQFIAAAVASFGAASACDRCGGPSASPGPCLSVSVVVPDAGATIEDDAAPPRPCLEIMDPPLDAGRPHPCLSIIMPQTRDAGATLQDDAAAPPRPCLKPVMVGPHS